MSVTLVRPHELCGSYAEIWTFVLFSGIDGNSYGIHETREDRIRRHQRENVEFPGGADIRRIQRVVQGVH